MLARYISDVQTSGSDEEEDSSVRYRRKLNARKRRVLFGFLYNYGQVFGSAFVMIYQWYQLRANELPWTTLRKTAVLVTIASYVFWAWARMQHGSNFSVFTTPKHESKLITDGLYARFSNPIYTFGCICIISFSLAVGKGHLIVLALVMAVVQVFRARREAVSLRKRFAEDYDEYIAGVWF